MFWSEQVVTPAAEGQRMCRWKDAGVGFVRQKATRKIDGR